MGGVDKATGIKLFGTVILKEDRQPKEKKEASISAAATEVEAQEAAALPCPRCKSMETKFCYFNNYNVNQPRHFCRACHRYWTAGGALRNVPEGAGRRKGRPTPPSSRAAAAACVLGHPSPPFMAGWRWLLRPESPERAAWGSLDGGLC